MEFDGSEILAELASRGLLEAFYEAVDNDDVGKIAKLLRAVDFDEETIKSVIESLDAL